MDVRIPLDAIIITGSCEFKHAKKYREAINLVDLLDFMLVRGTKLLFEDYEKDIPDFLKKYYDRSSKTSLDEFIHSLSEPKHILIAGAFCEMYYVEHGKYDVLSCVGNVAAHTHQLITCDCELLIDKHVLFDSQPYRTRDTYKIIEHILAPASIPALIKRDIMQAIAQKTQQFNPGFEWRYWPNK